MRLIRSAGVSVFITLVCAAAAAADIVRCEVVDRTHKLMPEWIEYEISARGTVLEIRDALGAQIGVDWVRGRISENTSRRMTLMWSVGTLPQQDGWWHLGQVNMQLTRLPDGKVLVVGKPSTNTVFGNISYNGRAICAE